jgi:hypothetical protein
MAEVHSTPLERLVQRIFPAQLMLPIRIATAFPWVLVGVSGSVLSCTRQEPIDTDAMPAGG